MKNLKTYLIIFISFSTIKVSATNSCGTSFSNLSSNIISYLNKYPEVEQTGLRPSLLTRIFDNSQGVYTYEEFANNINFKSYLGKEIIAGNYLFLSELTENTYELKLNKNTEKLIPPDDYLNIFFKSDAFQDKLKVNQSTGRLNATNNIKENRSVLDILDIAKEHDIKILFFIPPNINNGIYVSRYLSYLLNQISGITYRYEKVLNKTVFVFGAYEQYQSKQGEKILRIRTNMIAGDLEKRVLN